MNVDIVAPANELPGKLMDFIKYSPGSRPDVEDEIKDKSSLEKIIISSKKSYRQRLFVVQEQYGLSPHRETHEHS